MDVDSDLTPKEQKLIELMGRMNLAQIHRLTLSVCGAGISSIICTAQGLVRGSTLWCILGLVVSTGCILILTALHWDLCTGAHGTIRKLSAGSKAADLPEREL